jgi:hypothetical protein
MLIPTAKHVFVAFSIVFPPAFKLGGGEERGVTTKNSCTHNKYTTDTKSRYRHISLP